jgi:hypothetical protein
MDVSRVVNAEARFASPLHAIIQPTSERCNHRNAIVRQGENDFVADACRFVTDS